MLGRKPVIHVDGDAAESFDLSSAVECFIVETAEQASLRDTSRESEPRLLEWTWTCRFDVICMIARWGSANLPLRLCSLLL